jgi:integrase
MPFKHSNTKNYHYDFQIKGRRFHGSCGTEDFEEAKAVEAEARTRAKHNPQGQGHFTLGQAFGTYYNDIARHQPSGRTTHSQAKMILTVLKGTKRLHELTQQDLVRLVARRRATTSNATANRCLQMMGRAVRYMEKNYAAKVADLDFRAVLTKEATERVRELSYDEQERLFENLRPDLLPFTVFALMTGARRGTICDLRHNDIKHDTNRILFRLKGGKTMLFPTNDEIRALVGSQEKSCMLSERPFLFTFVNMKDQLRHRITSGGGLWEDWRKALDAAEIEDFRFHDLRHTFATRLLRATRNIKLVSKLLGHSEITTTSRYAHVLDEDLEDAMDQFSGITNPKSRSFSRSKKVY